jgi:hypothetical protein
VVVLRGKIFKGRLLTHEHSALMNELMSLSLEWEHNSFKKKKKMSLGLHPLSDSSSLLAFFPL